MMRTILGILIIAVASTSLLGQAPTQPPTGFSVTASTPTSITLSWSAPAIADADRTNYLILANTTGTFTDPTQGVAVTDDVDLTDGSAASFGVIGAADITFNAFTVNSGTQYFFKIYPYNAAGTSPPQYYLATPITTDGFTLAVAPANQPTAMVFSNITTTSMDVNFTAAVGGADGYIAVRRAGSSPTGGTPVDGTTYTAGVSTIGDGTVVFIGNTLPFNNTSLAAGTTYHYDIYSYNGAGASINYLTGSTPLEDSQSTAAGEPSFQPTAMTFSSLSTSGYNVGFTAATGSPDGYIAFRRSGSSPTTGIPVDGTTYSVNDVVGDGTVAFVGSGTSFLQNTLSAETEYFYDIFSFNGAGALINYRTTGPLEGNRFTLSLQPSNRAPSFSAATVPGTADIQLSFGAASGLTNADGYIILRNASGDPTTTGVVNGTAPGSLSLPGGTTLVTTINNTATTTYTDIGLSANTNYHYTIFSYNANASQDGQTFNYFTSNDRSANATTDCVAPTTQASAVTFGATQAGSVVVNWTRGNGNNVIVIARDGSASAVTPNSGTTYSANASFGDGDNLPVGGNDYFVVYSGSGTSVLVNNLSANTNYNFKVFEYNNTDVCYNTANTASNSVTTLSASNNTTLTNGTGIATIPSTATSFGTRVGVFNFTITDAGDDGSQTDISQMIFRPLNSPANNEIANFQDLILDAHLTDNMGGDQGFTATINPTNITISNIDHDESGGGTNELGEISDGGSKNYVLSVWLNDPLLNTLPTTVDGLHLALELSTADITTNGGQSGMTPGQSEDSDVNGSLTNGQISVIATEINITQQPSVSATATVTLAQQPIFEATDASGSRDLGFNNAITVNTGNPANLGPASSPANFGSGLADFTASGFNFGNVGMSTMSVTANAITSPNSSTITVSAATTLAGGTTGTEAGPNINNGSTNQALLGFSLQTTGSALNFTGATISTTSDPDVVLNNIRVFSSATADFASATNLGAAAPTTPGNSIVFSGLTAPISGTISYFFIVADVNSSFSVVNPMIQLSLTTANTSVSVGSTVGATQTGTLYTFVDATPPTIVSITNQVNPIFEGALTQTVVVQFSEPMNATGTFNPAIALTGSNWGAQAAGGWSTTTFTDDTYTTTFLHSATQETIPAATATISANTPRDLAGNAITNAPQSSAAFVVDNQKPTGTVGLSATAISTNSTSLTLTVTYSEPMDNTQFPIITFSPANGNLNAPAPTIANWNPARTIFTITYTHDLTPETVASITARANNAFDENGNVQTALSISPSFVIDTQRPVATISTDDANGFVRAGQTVVITANFSEPVADSPVMQIALSGANTVAATNMTKINSTQYTYNHLVSAGNGAINFSLSTGTDIAGNTVLSTPLGVGTITADDTAPILSSLLPQDNSHNRQVNENLRITLADANSGILKGTGTITLFRSDGTTIESFDAATSPNITVSSFTLIINPSFDLTQATSYYITIPSGAITDLAGNPFSGFSLPTNWNFTTFGPPIIDGVAPASGTSVCIDSDITELVITGSFLTGVTEVRFNGVAGLPAFDLNIISDTEIRANAPLNAQSGLIYVEKAMFGVNPFASTTSVDVVTTGPSSAVLSVGTIDNPTVCTSGTLISSTIKIDITGGTGLYEATYRITPGAMSPQDNLESSYVSGADIPANPIGTGLSNVFTIFEVADAAGCKIPNGSGSVPDQRNGSYAVFENQRPTVDAGGPPAPTKFNYCLTDGNDIDLDAATLGTAPSMMGAGGVIWTRNGSGTFSNANILEPTYTISAFDILNNNLELTITTTGNPTACDAAVDVLPIEFVSNSTADPGGSGGVLAFCWDGAPNPPVPLNGSIAGGATGYQWNSISGLNTQFSNTTIPNPTYTFNPIETANGFAEIELTPTGGTCGGPGAASPLRINLNAIPTNSFIGPKVNVCIGETVTYKLTSTTGNTYDWTVPATGGPQFEDNGNSINVTWGTMTGPYQISVIETRGTDMCPSDPIILNVTLNEEPIPSFIAPPGRSFGNRTDTVQLIGSGNVALGTTVFAGAGVLQSSDNKWYFSPKNATIGATLPTTIPITYTYSNTATTCSNSIQEDFFVYDESQAFILTDGGPIPSEICADNQAIEIRIDPAFIAANPISPYTFTSYSISDGTITNTAGTLPNNTDATATFDPASLGSFSTPKTIRITGTAVFQFFGIPFSRTYGIGDIIINPIPELEFNNIGNDDLCSNNAQIDLTKNETSNPGSNFSFFVDPTVSASFPGIISGNSTSGFRLNPNAYNSPSFDPTSIDIFYAFEDAKGCNDTTSVANANTLRISLTSQPPMPSIDIGNSICVTTGSVPTATISNVVSNSAGDAVTRWFNNPSLNPPVLSQNPDFFASINPSVNNTFAFFAAQEINGCISPVAQINYEVLNVPQFTWDKFCVDGTNTNFNLNLGSVNATDLTWTIRKSDGSIEATQSVTPATPLQVFPYSFGSGDRYDVTADVTSINGCIATKTLPVIQLEQFVATDTQIYSEDFEFGGGGFVPLTDDNSISPSTWDYGIIDKTTIKNEFDEPNNVAWVTNLSGAYNNGERSYLYSGCLDITGLARPLLSFSSWTNTDDKNDGVILQFSVDNKVINDPSKEWAALGDIGTGFDWYNRQLIQSIPGDKPAENFGWSGDFDTEWKESKHSLDQVLQELNNLGATNTVFRFAFAATDAATGKSLDGFAMDNFFIGNRTRTILLENFTNKGNTGNASLEANQSNTLKAFPPGGVGTQIVKINYHVGFPGEDPFNKDNGADPSARALYYNVTNTPSARLDGDKPAGPDQPFSQWGEQEYLLRTLQLGQSEIVITPTNNADGSINVMVDVTPNANLPQGTRLHIAILEELINLTDLSDEKKNLVETTESSFEFVLKKMLPSAPGLDTGPLDASTLYSFGPFTWFPESTRLYGQPNDLAVVAFLQDEKSKEIYQAEIVTDVNDPPIVTGLDFESIADRISIFPNPADGSVTVQLPTPAVDRIELQMVDQMGRVVNRSTIEAGEQEKEIYTRDMAGGIYLLQFGSGNSNTFKKVMVVHK